MPRTEWVYREAKLLETGVYPDKGVAITEAHLESIRRAFRAPAPILVEHRPSPLLLGWVVRVWRRGSELFGRLALFPEADALLRRLRLRGLSVGLSHDLRRLLEVSLTAHPRIADAQLFHSACAPSEVIRLDTMQMQTPEQEAYWQSRVRELEAELKRRDAREQIQQWSLRGQLPPALASLAEAILLQGDAPVQFSGESVSVAELFRRFVDSLPPHNLMGELAPTPPDEAPAFSADALAFLQQAFPDLNPADILRNKEVR
ncbi:MAG: hypothetical protein ACUVV1_06840 [Fimbriimonadales bacterium]